MNYSKVMSEASKKNETTKKKHVLVTKLPPPKKLVREKKGVQSAAVRAFLEKQDAEEKKQELEAKKKKTQLLKARSDANHNRKAHAMASRTKDNLKVYTPEKDGENVVNDDDVKVKPEDLSKKIERTAHEVSEDWFKKRQEILERMKKPKEPVVEKKHVTESNGTSRSKEKDIGEKHKESASSKHSDRHKNRESSSGKVESSHSQRNSDTSSSKHKRKHKHKHSSKDKERVVPKESPWISVKKKPVEEPVVEPKKKIAPKKPKQTMPPPMSYQDILRLALQQKENPSGSIVNGIQTNIPKKPEKEARPMTQDEKERAERKKSREYQHWLQHGGRMPGATVPEKYKSMASALPSREPSQDARSRNKHQETTVPVKTPPDNKSSASKTIQGHKQKTLKLSSGATNHPANKDAQSKGDSKSSNSGLKSSSGHSSSQKHTVDKHRSSGTIKTSQGNKERPGSSSKRKSEPQSDSEDDSPKSKKAKAQEEPQLSTWDRLYGQMHGKKQKPAKRRILSESYDEYEEEDFDADLSDFIDDGDGEEDYSSAIKEIFGYDKRKYRHIDEDDMSDMEAGFADVEREEAISAKIGYMEDLEDIRKEEEEKKRKLMKMKMKKKYKV